MNVTKIEKGMRLVLDGLGVSSRDPNFEETPERYARFMLEMFGNQQQEWATFPEDYTDFILLRGHRMYSLCPHHMLPVEFIVSLAYVPTREVLGLSKLARLLNEVNDGPLLQERFTKSVIDKVREVCRGVQGVAVIIDGQHGCMKIRGVRSDARLFTFRTDGIFKDNARLEDMFFRLAGHVKE
jgi:GTP cyclohydrolase IA